MEATIARTSEKASGLQETSSRPHLATRAAAPIRPARLEIDLDALRANYRQILRDKPDHVALCAVVKDEAYGHGALAVSRVAAEFGAALLAVSTLDEALALHEADVDIPILLLGERSSDELALCVEHQLQCCVSRQETISQLEAMSRKIQVPVKVHLKIDTGMSRYGVRWTDALPLAERIAHSDSLVLEGLMSHFAMSDERDKTHAFLQLSRFQEVLDQVCHRNLRVRYRHFCNSGGYLDLPEAHFDMVRIGLLALGVYPSQVCRRLENLSPVLSVKARLASIQNIRTGDNVGYGLRYAAPSPRRVAVLPIGYGDGYPRLRNQGHVLLHGRQAPIVGANAMDAMMIDITDIPEARLWDDATLLGRDGDLEITVHELAQWGQTVSYDILCGWRSRLPRLYRSSQA